LKLKESINGDYQLVWVMIFTTVALLIICITVIWPEHDKAMMELHQMPCATIKQSILGIQNNFWLHPEDYSKEIATRCSK